jgi:hypothetical protein
MTDARLTEKCMRRVASGFRQRGFQGRRSSWHQEDTSGSLRLITMRRWRGAFTIELNLVPSALLEGWRAVDHPVMKLLYKSGGAANTGFYAGLFVLAGRHPLAADADWLSPSTDSDVLTLADDVLDKFDQYGEPWFSKLTQPENALATIRHKPDRTDSLVEAALLTELPVTQSHQRLVAALQKDLEDNAVFGSDRDLAVWLVQRLKDQL